MDREGLLAAVIRVHAVPHRMQRLLRQTGNPEVKAAEHLLRQSCYEESLAKSHLSSLSPGAGLFSNKNIRPDRKSVGRKGLTIGRAFAFCSRFATMLGVP